MENQENLNEQHGRVQTVHAENVEGTSLEDTQDLQDRYSDVSADESSASTGSEEREEDKAIPGVHAENIEGTSEEGGDTARSSINIPRRS
ncbi:hypothetical protein [Pedobacter sp. SYSU D00535]|uniref:hypothetical protein n=1 Tax=Pedobacter sp. SYSU D00535 TaxID=2810308 RepID=UPI001A96E8A4|nr:hypothetical protein [Pedobacter sp. SYSU D00535]